MNCETGFLHSVGFWSVPVCRCVEDPRGARDWAHLRATDLYSVGSLGPDHDAVMRIGGKLRGAGPFSQSASVPCSNTASRHLGLSIGSRLKSQRERRIGKGMFFRAVSQPGAG